VSTHDHHRLQTMLNDYLYRKCHPNGAPESAAVGAGFGDPVTMRFGTDGAHVYYPPSWAVERFGALLQRLGLGPRTL
jgi:hypothetical protein